MSDIRNWLEKNNRFTGLGIAILTSAIIVVLSVYVYGEIIFLVPVVTFFSFHFTKLYKLKPRFLGSVVVFIIAAMLSSAIVANIEYSSHPTFETTFPNGIQVLGNVTPYGSVADDFHYTITITQNSSTNVNLSSVVLHIATSGYTANHILAASITNSSGIATYRYYYNTTDLPSGIYKYNVSYTETNGTVVYSGPMGGPVHDPEIDLFEGFVPTYLLTYLIYFELIFAVGVFIGRSIGNSMRYSQQRRNQPPPQS
ncbi:MAG: hypothetical protein AAE976_06355 [Thermoplasmataceae archaeon]